MEFDIEMLQNTVMAQIKSTKSILSDCRGLIKGISIPEDFSRSGTIKSAVGKISSIEDLLSLLGTSVSNSIAGFIAAQNKNNKIINSLGDLISINPFLLNMIDPDRLLTILKKLMETNSDQFTGKDLYGCDPYVYEKDGEYFYIKSTGNGIKIFKTNNKYDLEASEGKEIFSKDGSNIWAPELHYVNGR